MLLYDGKIDILGPSDEIEKQADVDSRRCRRESCAARFVDAIHASRFLPATVSMILSGARAAKPTSKSRCGWGIGRQFKKHAQRLRLIFSSKRSDTRNGLKCGTTTVEAKSGYGLTLKDELKILAVIQRLNQETPLEVVPTFLGAHAIPREDRESPERYVDLVINEMLPRVAKEKLAEFCDVFASAVISTSSNREKF